MAAVDEGLGHGQRRQHVAGRAAAGDRGVGPSAGAAAGRFIGAARRRTPSRAHRLFRAHPSSRPAAVIVTSSEVPPNDRNGRVRPVTGSMPVTPPMLMMAWAAIQAVMPPASSWLKRSAARSEVLTPRYRNDEEQADHADHADEAELLGDHGEDEVGVGLGQVAPLGPARTEAGAGDAARRDADERLPHLEARVAAVRGEVEEREPALAPVGHAGDERRPDHEQADRPRRSAGSSGVPPMKATASTIVASTMAEPRSPCSSTMRRGQRQHEHDGPERGLQVAHAVGPPGQQVGGVDQQHELQQLGGLEAERTEVEPGPRPVDLAPRARARGRRC